MSTIEIIYLNLKSLQLLEEDINQLLAFNTHFASHWRKKFIHVCLALVQ